MRISIIVAMAKGNVIGRDGNLPWHLSNDLKRFKSLTMGHHIVMGRKTYESIGRPLPGRVSVVVTRQASYSVEGVIIVHSLDEALQRANGDDEVFVIGGAQIYAQALPLAGRIYLTRVDGEVSGDTRFPQINLVDWRVVSESNSAADERNEFPHSFQVLDRMRSSTESQA
jgi:dihydrofolate reductase